jgi:hypothetical protein
MPPVLEALEAAVPAADAADEEVIGLMLLVDISLFPYWPYLAH